MPILSTAAGDWPWISRPSNTMRPCDGETRPEIVRKVELFPAPLAPIRQTSSPGAIVRSSPRSAAIGP